MKLVTNGKQWAVKRGWWKYKKYLDLKFTKYWWNPNDSNFLHSDVWGTKERAEECMGYYKHKKVK